MELHRISLKYFAAEPDSVDLERIVTVFHRWIQEKTVPGFLIDVADYKHVRHGPGVLLIGHDADYALDMAGGRPGLLYCRKRSTGATGATGDAALAGEGWFRGALRAVFRGALAGCRALEEEPALAPPEQGGRLRFRTDEARLEVLDRLRAPSTAETWKRLEEDIRTVLSGLYAGLPLTLDPSLRDGRECFSVHFTVPTAPDLSTLLARLEN